MYELQHFVNRLIFEGRYQESTNLLHSVMGRSRADFDILIDCGYLYSQLDKWEEALVFFRRAWIAKSFCTDPSRLSFLWYRMSIALMEVGDLDASIDAIDQAQQLLSTYDHSVDELEEYARIRAEIEYKAEVDELTVAGSPAKKVKK